MYPSSYPHSPRHRQRQLPLLNLDLEGIQDCADSQVNIFFDPLTVVQQPAFSKCANQQLTVWPDQSVWEP